MSPNEETVIEVPVHTMEEVAGRLDYPADVTISVTGTHVLVMGDDWIRGIPIAEIAHAIREAV